MRIITIITLTIMTVSAQASDVFVYGNQGVGYDPAIEVNVNQQRSQVDIYNYRTGYNDQIKLDSTGSGWGFNYQTGRMYDVDVDNYGNVDIWEY